jgi:23S rRNA (cytosine1962-C5)-methyltransferase
MQVGTPGMARLQEAWLSALLETVRPRSVLLKPNQSAANQERMSAPSGQLSGRTPDEIEIREHGLCLVAGLARDRDVLDCYSYTGAFAAHALRAGARAVTCVESSAPARTLLARNLEAAGGRGERRVVDDDAVGFLGDCRQRFGLAVVDPPALAKRRRHLDRASRVRSRRPAALPGRRCAGSRGLGVPPGGRLLEDRAAARQLIARPLRGPSLTSFNSH